VHGSDIPVVTSNDMESFLAAFGKRCNFLQEKEGDDIDDPAFEEACAVIDALPDIFPAWDENPVDRERWMGKFDQKKRDRMDAAWSELPDATPSYLGQKDLSVKQEVLIKRNDPSWAPRVIYAGNDQFNTCTGPASMVVMERVVALSRQSKIGPIDVKFAYKANDVELVNHIHDPAYPEIVEGDFSRNDREQRSRVALIYDRWLGKLNMPQWFRDLLLQLETYQVRSRRFNLSATLQFQLPTGTTSTTPRNSVYNATMFAVACLRQKIKSGKALILGDDLLAALLHRLCLNKWVMDVASFKMVLKAKAPQLNGEATFLSRRLVLDSPSSCMVPLLGKTLVRFNVRGTHNDACSDSAYMAGKALSYAYEYRHIPMLRDIFLQRFELEEDAPKITISEVSWFTRTSGVELKDMVAAIKNEKTLIEDDEFSLWVCEFYDSDLEEVRELFEDTILCQLPLVLDDPRIQRFSHDYA